MTEQPFGMALASPSARELGRGATSPGRKVQIALDMRDTPAALAILQKTAGYVDVIEVGTLLCLSEGMGAVRAVRAAYPDHVLLADIRIAEAGGLLSRLAFDAGADWVSVVSGASPATFEVVAGVAAEVGGDVQVELSEGWTWALVERCRSLGIAHFILHRSRDAEARGQLEWPARDLDAIVRIHDMGGRVTVTGGMTVAQVQKFDTLPVEIFIAGRAIYAAEDPRGSAGDLHSAVGALRELKSFGPAGHEDPS